MSARRPSVREKVDFSTFRLQKSTLKIWLDYVTFVYKIRQASNDAYGASARGCELLMKIMMRKNHQNFDCALLRRAAAAQTCCFFRA